MEWRKAFIELYGKPESAEEHKMYGAFMRGVEAARRMPEWAIEASEEIDLLFGELNISEEVAEIILKKYLERK